MELTDSLKSLFIETAKSLQGSARRLFMARTVKELGAGGQRRAERELGWGRMTMRTGLHELESGCTCLDAFAARGRKRVDVSLPNLLPEIRAMIDSHSQADPQCRTHRLSTRLSAAEVRRQLLTHKGDADDPSPPYKPSQPSATLWATLRRRWPKVSRKKNPSNLRHLRPRDTDQS